MDSVVTTVAHRTSSLNDSSFEEKQVNWERTSNPYQIVLNQDIHNHRDRKMQGVCTHTENSQPPASDRQRGATHQAYRCLQDGEHHPGMQQGGPACIGLRVIDQNMCL